MSRLRLAALVLACGALLTGCKSGEEVDTSKPSRFGFQTSIQNSLLAEGKLHYDRYCVGCHGDKGDGNGAAAVFLNPKPRNFIKAEFKFSSTRSGQLPTDADLKRTLRNGLRGSAMPAFNLLPDRSIEALIVYLKSFSPAWAERDPAQSIPIVEDPYRTNRDKSEAIARGEAVYHGFASCWSCHPSYVSQDKIQEYTTKTFGGAPREGFRPNLSEAEGKENEEGQMIYPPDFKRDFVRAGVSVDDLYRSIAAGITGSAMPTWIDSIDVPGKTPNDPPVASRADLWAMAYYVQCLIERRPALLADGHFKVRNRPFPIYLKGEPQRKPAEAPESVAPATTQPAQSADDQFVE